MTNTSLPFKQTVVYRGVVDWSFKDRIVELRNWFDGEVVVSTWKGLEQYAMIPGVDKVSHVEDPGPGPIQNYDRQVASFFYGVTAAEGEVVCCVRTDCKLTKNIFLNFNPQPATGKFRCLDYKIVVGNMMSIHPARMHPKDGFFLVGDWVHIGTNSDMRRFGLAYPLLDAEFLDECTERGWLLSIINQHAVTQVDASMYHRWSVSDALEAMLGNFTILNTRSTLGVENLKWAFQPEFLPLYITEAEAADLTKKMML